MFSCIPAKTFKKKHAKPIVTIQNNNCVEIIFTNGRHLTVSQQTFVIENPDDNIERRSFENEQLKSKKFPKSMLCPITKAPMIDPVICLDGHSYERKAITRWFKKKKSSPVTNAKLNNTILIPNHALRNSITTFTQILELEEESDST